MFDDTEDARPEAGADPADSADAGDGLHHHEIHEDEGGGFHSKHVHPDGREEHEDHVSYDDAKDWQDERFGHGEPEGDEADSADDGSGGADMNDIAGSYGRKASCD